MVFHSNKFFVIINKIAASPLLFFLFLLSWHTNLHAQSDDIPVADQDTVLAHLDLELVHRGNTMKAYRLSKYLRQPHLSPPDTTASNYYRTSYAEGAGVAIGHNANGVGFRHQKIFFDRPLEWDPFFFSNAYKHLLYAPNKIFYYNTQSPYSKLTYRRFGTATQREEEGDMTIAINYNKHINFGIDFDYLLSRGHYLASKAKMVNYRLFGSYCSDRYQLFVSGGNNYLRISENGGIVNDEYITNPGKFSGGRQRIKSIELPVRYPSGVGNSLWNGHVNLSHSYHLGSKKRFWLGDRLPNGERTAVDTTLFVPIATIGHAMEWRSSRRIFVGNNESLGQEYNQRYEYFHPGRYGSNDTIAYSPFDSTSFSQLSNTVSLSLREGFRPWVKFGLSAYARMENRFYYIPDESKEAARHKDFTTYVGGKISRQSGRGLNFDVNTEVAVLGHDIGNIRVDGDISTYFTLFKFPLHFTADAKFYNVKPPLLMQKMHSSFLRWDQEMPFVQTMIVGGSASLPRFGTTLSAHYATLGNYIYFGNDRLPAVCPSPIHVVEARVQHLYHWRILNCEIEGVYQLSSNKEALPLPMFAGRMHIFLQFPIAKVMFTQAGIECYYHTSYKAPTYDIASMQFYNQNESTIGNYPILNAYANFKLRRVRFYVVYYNWGDFFLRGNGRFSLPHYPTTPPNVRLGISFDFNN